MTTPSALGTNFILSLCKFSRSLWTNRNSLVHEATTEAISSLTTQNLHNQVRQLFTSFELDPSFILPRHHHLFTTWTLDQRLSQQPDNIQCWLRSVEAARQTLESYVRGQQRLASIFFPTSVNTASSSDSTYVASDDDDISLSSYAIESTSPLSSDLSAHLTEESYSIAPTDEDYHTVVTTLSYSSAATLFSNPSVVSSASSSSDILYSHEIHQYDSFLEALDSPD
jgi:hypothetical protein